MALGGHFTVGTHFNSVTVLYKMHYKCFFFLDEGKPELNIKYAYHP